MEDSREIIEWIYGDNIYSSKESETIRKIEKAIGFKLFFWQKSYIELGKYRRSGRTTAFILRRLLVKKLGVINWTDPPNDPREEFIRWETTEIADKLNAAGLEINPIAHTAEELERFRQKEQKRRDRCEACEYKSEWEYGIGEWYCNNPRVSIFEGPDWKKCFRKKGSLGKGLDERE